MFTVPHGSHSYVDNFGGIKTIENCIEHVKGNVDIIISIPHGGNMDPKTMPNRRCKCEDKSHEKCPVVHGTDHCTVHLGSIISQSIEKHLNRTPHMVINHLKRKKLDPNRSIEFGAQNHPTARTAFKTYHGFINQAKSTFKRGLLIDLHGRNKSDGLTQIGYNITKADLITETYQVNESSIGTLAMENSAIDYIGGKYSFGDLMESEGYAAVPSPAQRRPPENGVYYSGGYITQHHGNSDILDAIQLETPSDLRTKDTIRFGFILGRIISTFYHLHYCDLPNKRRHA